MGQIVIFEKFSGIFGGGGGLYSLRGNCDRKGRATAKTHPDSAFGRVLIGWVLLEQCQVVVFIADDLGFLGPGSPDLMTELCPPQDAA